MELLEGVLELLHFLVTLPRRVRRIRQRRAIHRGRSGADVTLLDIAMANKGRRPPEQRRGGMIRSGDLDVAIGTHLVISRERALVRRLELRGRLVFFKQDDGTVALYSLGQNMVQEYVLDASELTAAEWALFAEMVAEVTNGRMVIDPLPPFAGP
jgi:hypothetical protein